MGRFTETRECGFESHPIQKSGAVQLTIGPNLVRDRLSSPKAKVVIAIRHRERHFERRYRQKDDPQNYGPVVKWYHVALSMRKRGFDSPQDRQYYCPVV